MFINILLNSRWAWLQHRPMVLWSSILTSSQTGRTLQIHVRFCKFEKIKTFKNLRITKKCKHKKPCLFCKFQKKIKVFKKLKITKKSASHKQSMLVFGSLKNLSLKEKSKSRVGKHYRSMFTHPLSGFWHFLPTRIGNEYISNVVPRLKCWNKKKINKNQW